MTKLGKAGPKVAVVGATGAVGQELLSILEERKFPISELLLFASSSSVGKSVQFRGQAIRIRALEKACFQGVDLAFFGVSDALAREFVPQAAECGAWVIDKSATYRMEADIPLVVPEVNPEVLRERLARPRAELSWRERIFACPNCSTTQLVVTLKPLHDHWGLKRVSVSSYQSTSGAGSAAMQELSAQTIGLLNQKIVPSREFSHQIAFNCIPQIGGFKADGYTSEEHKIMEETRKILKLPELRISATAVRVPTFSCHAETVQVECLRPVSAVAAREILSKQEGLIVQDDPSRGIYPMGMTLEGDPVQAASGRDAVYVGRIREDQSLEHGLNLWVVSDNLRKGAALNAIQIGEILVRS